MRKPGNTSRAGDQQEDPVRDLFVGVRWATSCSLKRAHTPSSGPLHHQMPTKEISDDDTDGVPKPIALATCTNRYTSMTGSRATGPARRPRESVPSHRGIRPGRASLRAPQASPASRHGPSERPSGERAALDHPCWHPPAAPVRRCPGPLHRGQWPPSAAQGSTSLARRRIRRSRLGALERADQLRRSLLRPVINATGVLLHTTSAAPHSRDATGSRHPPRAGPDHRPPRLAPAHCVGSSPLCGAEDAMVVNTTTRPPCCWLLAALARGARCS